MSDHAILRACFEELLERLADGADVLAVFGAPDIEQLNRLAESLGFQPPMTFRYLRRRPDQGKFWKVSDPATSEIADETNYDAMVVDIMDPFAKGEIRRIVIAAGARKLCEANPDAPADLKAMLRRWVKFLESAPDMVKPVLASLAPVAAAPPYTLGDLIRDLEGSEQAYAQTKATADRKAAVNPILADWWYVQAAALRWQPDPARMPGIERIELVCDRLYGSGITAESVRRLRAKLCDDHHMQLPRVADQLDLVTVANIIEGVREVSLDGMQKSLQDDFHHGLATQNQIWIGGEKPVQITGLSCKVIAGTMPTACPDANPAVPPSVLPAIDKTIRRLNKLPAGTTIHWVGHDTGYRQRCQCPEYRDAPYAAPFDAHRWAEQVKIEPNANVVVTASDPPITPPSEKRRGRKQKFDPAADEAYLAEWAKSQKTGMNALQFEEAKGDEPGTVERTQARVRDRAKNKAK